MTHSREHRQGCGNSRQERRTNTGSGSRRRRDGGFTVVDLSVAEPSLETVFINLTGKELRD